MSKYLEFLLEEAVVENDWENYFSGLFEKISHLSNFFEIEDNILIHHCARKIHLLRSLKYSAAFYLGRKDLDSAFYKIEEFSKEVQKIFYYFLLSNPFTANPKYFYLDLIYSCQELTFSLVLLANSPIYQESKVEMQSGFVFLSEFFLFFGLYFISVSLESWILLGQIADELLEILRRNHNSKSMIISQNIDYIQIFGNLRLLTEGFSDFKQKNMKSLKKNDVYSDMFHINSSAEYERNFNCSTLEEIDFKQFLFKMVIKYLATAYIKQNLKMEIKKAFEFDKDDFSYDQNQFQIENILFFIDSFEEKSYKALKCIFNKFGSGELNSYLEDLKKIINVCHLFKFFIIYYPSYIYYFYVFI